MFEINTFVFHKIVKDTSSISAFEDVTIEQFDKFINTLDDTCSYLITFDDGFETDFTIFNKYYEKFSHFISFQSFVNTDFIDTPGFLSQTQIIQMHSVGWKFGSHTSSHQNLKYLSYDDLVSELNNSKVYLSNLLNSEVNDFSIPFGIYNKKILCIINLFYSNVYSSSLVSSDSTLPRMSVNSKFNNFRKSYNIKFRQFFFLSFKEFIIYLLGQKYYVKFRDFLFK